MSLFISKISIKRDREAEGMKNFVLDCRQECLQVLRFGGNGVGAEVGVTCDRSETEGLVSAHCKSDIALPVERCLLLAMGRIGDSVSFVTPVSLHGGHVEDEVSLLDASSG